jgi:hypothetical protein
LATNYCEIITDPNQSNKKEDNIWESVITLIKATSQEIEKTNASQKEMIDKNLTSIKTIDNFIRNFEYAHIFYPLIVFEGRMFEAKVNGNEIWLEQIPYVRLLVDYDSGNYEGTFCIDIINSEGFQNYLSKLLLDMDVFDDRRTKDEKRCLDVLLKIMEKYLTKKSPLIE